MLIYSFDLNINLEFIISYIAHNTLILIIIAFSQEMIDLYSIKIEEYCQIS